MHRRHPQLQLQCQHQLLQLHPCFLSVVEMEWSHLIPPFQLSYLPFPDTREDSQENKKRGTVLPFQSFNSLGNRYVVLKRKGYRYSHWEAAELLDFHTHIWQLWATQTQNSVAALPARGPAHPGMPCPSLSALFRLGLGTGFFCFWGSA